MADSSPTPTHRPVTASASGRPFHLAQLNVARLLAPLDTPELADFMANLDPVNALADQSRGFVWRLQTDDGNATSIRPFDDDMELLNMSVWESPEALREFTYRSDHRQFLARRREWFERTAEVYLVLWWVPAGHTPTVEEAIERLELLRRSGPSPAAFTFRTLFPPPDTAATVDDAEPYEVT